MALVLLLAETNRQVTQLRYIFDFKYEVSVFLLARYWVFIECWCWLLRNFKSDVSLHGVSNILWHTNFSERLHDIDAVLHNLSHGHLVALEDRFDSGALSNTVWVKLAGVHLSERVLGDGRHAVDEGSVCLDELLQHWLVVQNLALFCHDFQAGKFIYYLMFLLD